MAHTEFQSAKEWFLRDLNCNNKAEGTIKAYKADLNNLEVFLKQRFPGLLNKLTDLKASHVIQYREYLNTQGYSRRTVDRKYYCFRKFMKFLKMTGFVEKNVTLDVEHTKYKSGVNSNYLTWDEVFLIIDMALLFGGVNRSRDVALLSMLAYTGCRRSEALGLNWSDVDFATDSITLYRPKTKVTDKIKMTPALSDALRRYYLECRSQASGPVFVSDRGARISVTNLKQIFSKYVRYSGLNKGFAITPHTLRHSFITNLVIAKTSLTSIQRYSGHKDLESLQVYIHLSFDGQNEVLDNIPHTA